MQYFCLYITVKRFRIAVKSRKSLTFFFLALILLCILIYQLFCSQSSLITIGMERQQSDLNGFSEHRQTCKDVDQVFTASECRYARFFALPDLAVPLKVFVLSSLSQREVVIKRKEQKKRSSGPESAYCWFID